MSETSAMQTAKKVDELIPSALTFGRGDLGTILHRRFTSLLDERNRYEAALRSIVDGGHRVKARAIARDALMLTRAESTKPARKLSIGPRTATGKVAI